MRNRLLPVFLVLGVLAIGFAVVGASVPAHEVALSSADMAALVGSNAWNTAIGGAGAILLGVGAAVAITAVCLLPAAPVLAVGAMSAANAAGALLGIAGSGLAVSGAGWGLMDAAGVLD